ncbi:unnamed protein product [Amoebophrya sp. A25]|nr:unnamed protein product [Amoebophrya sp. A25]|eukprot:GSA25T00015305001.1
MTGELSNADIISSTGPYGPHGAARVRSVSCPPEQVAQRSDVGADFSYLKAPGGFRREFCWKATFSGDGSQSDVEAVDASTRSPSIGTKSEIGGATPRTGGGAKKNGGGGTTYCSPKNGVSGEHQKIRGCASGGQIALDETDALSNSSGRPHCKVQSLAATNELIRSTTLEFLVSGGDDRLLLNKDGCNKYNTPALPQPRGIHRSSCTSNCATDYSFAEGSKLISELLQFAGNENHSDGRRPYIEAVDRVRNEIRRVWQLPDAGCAITLCPSGSDAEYIPLLLALCRIFSGAFDGDEAGSSPPEVSSASTTTVEDRKASWGSGILSLIAGAGEVGSGTTGAATGHFFSSVMPKPGFTGPQSGDAVFNLPQGFPQVQAMEVVMRNKGGGLKGREDMDDEVRKIVEAALTEQSFQVVVVHLVSGSKTGHLIPSLSVLEELSQTYGKRIVPVVDACQARLSEGALRTFLDSKFVVLTTGSKFYGGPPFSGAVLLPLVLAQELDACEDVWGRDFGGAPFLKYFPLFMDDVLLSHDLKNMRRYIHERINTPKSVENHSSAGTMSASSVSSTASTEGVCAAREDKTAVQLPNQGFCIGRRCNAMNWGLVLRWTMALNEIRKYHSIPERVRNAIMLRWVDNVNDILQRMDSPFLSANDGDGDYSSVTANPLVSQTEQAESGELTAGMFGINTIVSLVCRVPTSQGNGSAKTRRLGQEDLKKLHRLMTQDLSEKIHIAEPQQLAFGHLANGTNTSSDNVGNGGVEGEQKSSTSLGVELQGPFGSYVVEAAEDILRSKCFIAQPVQLQQGMGKLGLTVIRVAIGAPLVHWAAQHMQKGFAFLPSSCSAGAPEKAALHRTMDIVAKSDAVLLRKMALILEHWDAVCGL